MKIPMLKDECWWGGAIHAGTQMPFDLNSRFAIDLRQEMLGNQSAPLFVSSKGRALWHHAGFAVTFREGVIETDVPVELSEGEGGVRGACKRLMQAHFPPDGAVPEPFFFQRAQYNTWAELTYGQSRDAVLNYARKWLENGYKPGVLMIDDTWQADYGVWRFNETRFPDPAGMIDELHQMGYRVMVWVCPYLSADSAEFRELEAIPGALARDAQNRPAILHWWNGYSAALDFRSEGAQDWMAGALKRLMTDVGIDGFKFDGGSINNYREFINPPDAKPEELCAAWTRFALRYRFEEVKDSFGFSGKACIQRLRDKRHSWTEDGLNCVIPDAIALSLTGHFYLCPDMIGGGEWTCFLPGSQLDEELIVRFAQCAALFPMMQYSVAPWRVLSPENAAYLLEAEKLHLRFSDEIMALVRECAQTGEPMLRPLSYNETDGGYEYITDEFMLGRELLVAPVLEKGKRRRRVTFPSGKWSDEHENIYTGPCTAEVDAPLSCLPWFRRMN